MDIVRIIVIVYRLVGVYLADFKQSRPTTSMSALHSLPRYFNVNISNSYLHMYLKANPLDWRAWIMRPFSFVNDTTGSGPAAGPPG